MKLTDTAIYSVLRLGAFKRGKQQADNDSFSLSRPQSVIVHGIKVDKAPIGRYLDLTKRLPNIVMEVLDATFPDMKPDDILHLLSTASDDQRVIRDIITRLLAVAPEKAMEIACGILGASMKDLCALTPSEFLDVVEAFGKLNDYRDFFQHVRRAAEAVRHPNTPSKGGSLAPDKSE